jgi:hypothetical protein
MLYAFTESPPCRMALSRVVTLQEARDNVHWGYNDYVGTMAQPLSWITQLVVELPIFFHKIFTNLARVQFGSC